MAAAPWVVSDELWELVEPLLPRKERRFRYPGRRRFADRQALQGILFVLHTGIAWQHLPPELGFGSGVTCWRRLDEWQQAGVWERLHALLAGAAAGGGRDRVVAGDRRLEPGAGEKGGSETGPSPVDRGRPGSKHHLLVDASGIPLALVAHGRQPQRRHPADPAARRACPRSRACVGRPRRRPDA